MERRFTPTNVTPLSVLELRDDGTPKAIVGYAAVFYRDDNPGTEYELWSGVMERIDSRAFDRAIQEDDVRGLFNHDPDNLLGRTPDSLKLSVDDVGLRYEIPIDATDPDHARVTAKMERGDLSGSSFSFRVEKETWEEGKDGAPDLRTIEAVTLYDVGPVTFPAYEASTAGLRSEGETDEASASYNRWLDERAKARSANEYRVWQRMARARVLEINE